MNLTGLDLGHAGTRAAEHWLADLPPVPGLVACTHLVHGERPRVVITIAVPDGVEVPPLPSTPDDSGALDAAVADHAAGWAGRAVIYPGVSHLTGYLTVAELLAGSAISRIRLLGAADTEPDSDTIVDTRDFVRPQWMDGRLTLVATPAPAGRIAPFEVPNPTPCCGGEH
jgi:hypothetical protein